MRLNPVTVLIPTHNSVELLPDLLEDVQWADQILVVDSYSTDGTPDFCKERGIECIQNEYINSANQKNWAIPKCNNPWILLLDTDERLPAELQVEIQLILDGIIETQIDAFRVARKTIFLDEWLTVMNLWPDYQVRLFRRDVGRYEDKEVHADVIVPGQIRALNIPLVHNATPTLSKQINLLDRYSRYQADELAKQGITFRWVNLLLRPIISFIYLYVYKGGYKAGFRGLFIAYHSMSFVFLTHAKLWEKRWQTQKNR